MKKKEELRITLPTAPSDGLREMVENSEWAKMEGLLYEISSFREPITGLRQKAVKVTCTGCGMSYYEDYAPPMYGGYGFRDSENGLTRVGDGDVTRCPCCETKATAVRKGGFRYEKVIGEEWPSELRQVEGKACFIGWRTRILVDKDAGRWYEWQPWEAYVLYGKTVVRFAAHRKNIGGGECVYPTFEERKRYEDEWQACTVSYVPEGVLTGTEAENSRWDKYCRTGECYPVSYIRHWIAQPVLEAIVETGGGRLITDALEGMKTAGGGYYYKIRIPATPIRGISQKERKPSAALGLTKEEYAAAIRKRWPFALVKLVAKMERRETRKIEEDADRIMELGDRCTEDLFETCGKEAMRTVRYLLRQKAKGRRGEVIDWRYYKDYLHMAEENGEDMDAVRYPRDLIDAHDRAMVVEKERRSRENRQEFRERADKLLALAWEKDGLLIRPAMSAAELQAEGANLSHCVGGYAEKMRRSETAILFIRRSESPNASFYTLELDERLREVKQNRGNHNCARTPEVEAFEAAWLEHVRKDLIRDKDGTWKEKRKNERRNDETAA